MPNISIWNTGNVIYMKAMFSECSSLTSFPDISNWKTNKLININYIFSLCKSLKNLPDISKWNLNNITFKKGIFNGNENK